MSFFSLPNGKKFDLSYIKSEVKIDENNGFLKKYDANNNSIFEANELDKLKKDLEPYIADGKIDKEEYINWYAKVMGMTVDAVKNLFKTGEKSEEEIEGLLNSSLSNLEEAQAGRECTEYIRNAVLREGKEELLSNTDSIIKLWNELKKLVGDKLSSHQLYKIIVEELFSAEYLEKAGNGTLTKTEYIEKKIENVKDLMMARIMQDSLDDVKKWVQEQGLPWNEGKFIKYMDDYLTSTLRSMVINNSQSAGGNRNLDFDSAAESIDILFSRILSMDDETGKEFFNKMCIGAIEKEIQNYNEYIASQANHGIDTVPRQFELVYQEPLGLNNKITFENPENLTFNQVLALEHKENFNVQTFQEYIEAALNMEDMTGEQELSLGIDDINALIQEIEPYVADNTYVFNKYAYMEEIQPEYEVTDPYQEALLTVFFLSNQDILQDMTRYMVGRELIENRTFKDLEEVAEYLLKKQGKECTDDSINKLAKELIILNSNGDETDFDSMVNNALANINKGNVRYINRDFDITENGVLTKDLISCGIEPTEENMHIYQMMHLFEKDLIDGTYGVLAKNINEIYRKCGNNIEDLYINLKKELTKYKGSPLAERWLYQVELLKRNNITDIQEWCRRISPMDYFKQQGEVQDLFTQYSLKKISLAQLKETLLLKYGMNIYSKEEQGKVQELRIQDSIVNLISGIYDFRANAFEDMYQNGGIFYDLYNTLTESADTIANMFGGDVSTNAEYIQFLKDSSDFWEECSPDKMTYAQFQQVFKKIFGKDFNVEAVKDLLEYCASHPDLNVLSDVHREFLDKFEAVFGMDFLKQLMNDNAKLNTDKISSGLGNIALMIFAMKYIAGSALMEGVSFNASTFYRALGLSGKGLQLATGMTVGGTTFATYTLATQSLDNVIMQRDLDAWAELPGQVGESFAFGAFASAVNILLISPLTAPQFEKGLKAAAELVDNSGGAVSGEEFLRTFYEGQLPVIQDEFGKVVYSTLVNTGAFTAYGIGEDLIKNGTEPLKNGNVGKYIGEVALSNLQNILTFEGLQMLIGGSIAGRTSAESAREMTIEEVTQYFNCLKNFTIEKTILAPDMYQQSGQGQLSGAEQVNANVNGQMGQSLVKLSDGSIIQYVPNTGTGSATTFDFSNCQEVYVLNFPNGRIAVNSIAEAYSLTLNIMAWEIQCKNAMSNIGVDNFSNPQLQSGNPVSDFNEEQPTETGLITRPEASVAPQQKPSPRPVNPEVPTVKPTVAPEPVEAEPPQPGISQSFEPQEPFDIPSSSAYGPSVEPQPQPLQAEPETTTRTRTQFKERVRVLIQDLKTMGADGKVIENIDDLIENGDVNNLPALEKTLTDIANQGKQTSVPSGQSASDPLIILNVIFNCPPEVIPVKIEAYMYAKANNLSDVTTINLIDAVNINDDVEAVAGVIDNAGQSEVANQQGVTPADIIDEFDMYLQGLSEHGEGYVPEFIENASPLFKEFFEYRRAESERLQKLGVRVRTKKYTKMEFLNDVTTFMINDSNLATREDYIKITNEIADLMPAYVRENYPNVRPEIADNADRIYRWKAAMAGQIQESTPDTNGVYPIITNKFFDAEAHAQAVREFTEFLENMTGKKVLVGNSARFGEFINMLGCFNNPDFYKDVDYIVLGHGTGSSLVTDMSDPNVWRFKHSGEAIWEYIANNVPEGKKVLLLVCEHDGLTLAERKQTPEMYDDNGIYMEGIGDPANGMVGSPAKIVVSGVNRIVGTVECKKQVGPSELISGGIGGEVTIKRYSVNNISSHIDLQNDSYITYTDKNGNKIYKVVATATQNPRNGGWDYTYNVYKVDANGNIIEELNGVTDKEIRQKYGKLKNEQIHENPGADNSGYLYFGIPFFKKVWNKFTGKEEDANSYSMTMLEKGQPFEIQSSAKLNLANQIEIDLNDAEIKSRIDNLPEGGRLTIGREGNIRINDPSNHVSRIHVIIEKRNGKIYVIDNSTNGTVVIQTYPPSESVPQYQSENSAPVVKSKQDLYQIVKNLNGYNMPEDELRTLFNELDVSPESLTQYSMIVDNLIKFGGGSKNFKDLLKFAEKKNIKPDELNKFFETVLNSVENPEGLLKNSGYDDCSEFLNAFLRLQPDVSINELNHMIETYTKYYGKIPNYFALHRIMATEADYISYMTKMMEKYGNDSRYRDIVNILNDNSGFLISNIKDAPDELTALNRTKMLQERIHLGSDFYSSELKLSDIFEMEEEKFNQIIQKLDILRQILYGTEKINSYEAVYIINKILELDDIEFQNITKRNLCSFSNEQDLALIFELAKLSDVEFSHFEQRGLEVNLKNIALAKLTDKEWQNFQNRRLKEDKYTNDKPAYLAKLTEEEWAIVEKYHLASYPRMNANDIKHLLELGEPYIKKLQDRKILGFIHAGNWEYAEKFARMSDAEFQNVIDRNLTSAIPNQQYDHGPKVYLTLEEIDMLRTLDDNKFKKVWDALSTNRGILDASRADFAVDLFFGPFTVKQAIELAQLSDTEYANLKSTGALEVLSMQNLRAFIDFQYFLNIKNYNDLTTADKKRLAALLVKHNQALFSTEFQDFINARYGQNVIPNNQSEYCSLLRTVIRDSKIEVNPITKSQQEIFEETIADMSNPNGAFLKADLEADNFRLDLKYPRDQFMKDVMSALDGLSNAEKQRIMDYYGFEIYTKDGQLVISGYPQVLKNMPELNSSQGRKVAELVERFTTENKIVITGDPVLSQMLNDIFDTFPELRGIIGKVQHGTHHYTVDVHTLKVLQGVMSNPAFKNLSASDKKVITIATLMHDISKKEMEIDKQHPQNSATEAYQLLQKLDLSESEMESIYKIIRYHDWLEKYNVDGITPEERTAIAQHLAYELRDGNNFMLAAMLTEADLKGVQRNDAFWEIYQDAFDRGVTEISAIVRQIKNSQIYIPQMRIPKASQLRVDGVIVTEEIIDGHRVKVLHLKKGQDLSKVGFPKGTTSDDIQLLYHGIASEDAQNLELVLSCMEIDYDGVLSHSIISASGQEVYSPYGVISYAPNSHLIAGSYYNIGSGYQSDKTIGNMIDRYIFSENLPSPERTYFSDKIKEKLNIDDDAYIKLFDRISGMSLTELKQYDPVIGKAVEEVMYETDILRQQTYSYVARGSSSHITEVLVHNIEAIQAIGCPYGRDALNGIPEYFLKYAEENDIVVVSIEND